MEMNDHQDWDSFRSGSLTRSWNRRSWLELCDVDFWHNAWPCPLLSLWCLAILRLGVVILLFPENSVEWIIYGRLNEINKCSMFENMSWSNTIFFSICHPLKIASIHFPCFFFFNQTSNDIYSLNLTICFQSQNSEYSEYKTPHL